MYSMKEFQEEKLGSQQQETASQGRGLCLTESSIGEPPLRSSYQHVISKTRDLGQS